MPPHVNTSALDGATERAVRAFLRHLNGRYPVRQGILFGSRARHAHGTDSDADLAIVLDGAPGDRHATARDMAGIAFDVMLETGILVDAIPIWQRELDDDTLGDSPLLRSIRDEGLRV